MGAIVIVVFLLTFLLLNWLFEFLNSRNSFTNIAYNQYEIVKGNRTKVKVSKFNTLIKLNTNYYLKKIIPMWSGLFIIALLLFKSFLIALILSIMLSISIFIYIKLNKQLKRKELFISQFREALVSMSNSLKAGATLPMALDRCKNELNTTLYNQTERPMLRELEIIVNEINMGNNLSQVLLNFMNRVNMEEVDNFVNAAIITEKTGGNLSEVMINVCTIIGDRIQMKREIDSLTAGKRSESRVLTIVPFIMIPLLATLSPSYLKPMYETLIGKILMVIGILLLVANIIISKKIMDIKL